MIISYSAEQCGHLKMVMMLAGPRMRPFGGHLKRVMAQPADPNPAILRPDMASDPKSFKETALEAENADLRDLLAQAGLDAARILKQAGIDAIENEVAKRLQRLLLEELHHRVKNTLATVIAITSQSLRNAASLEEGQKAVESRLVALGRAHDLLLQAHWTSAKLTDVIGFAIAPFESRDVPRFAVQARRSKSARTPCCRSPCRSTSSAPTP